MEVFIVIVFIKVFLGNAGLLESLFGGVVNLSTGPARTPIQELGLILFL